jgi:D-glucosaminate-specific PTS system IID component
MDQKVENNQKMEPEKITKRDVTLAWIRWFAYSEVSNNFERLQALAFCGAMTGILEKLYKRKEDLAVALSRHLGMFNTQANWGSIIPGITVALEEKAAANEAEESEGEEDGEAVSGEAIIGIKTGLMGPLAGIGDTLDYGTLRPILMGIFIPFALNGSVGAALMPLIIQTTTTAVIGYTLFHRGYSTGKKSIIEILQSGKIQQVITSASVLGMFMMGALSASYVKLSTPLMIGTAVEPLKVQGLIDSLAPKLLPLFAVMGIYIFLMKVGPKYVRIVSFLVLISLLGAALGVF